jgi:hypothetical protein
VAHPLLLNDSGDNPEIPAVPATIRRFREETCALVPDEDGLFDDTARHLYLAANFAELGYEMTIRALLSK